jgi:hypothetical protein
MMVFTLALSLLDIYAQVRVFFWCNTQHMGVAGIEQVEVVHLQVALSNTTTRSTVHESFERVVSFKKPQISVIDALEHS